MRGSQVTTSDRATQAWSLDSASVSTGLRNRSRGRGRRRSPRWPAAVVDAAELDELDVDAGLLARLASWRPSRPTHRGRGSRPADPTHRSRARRLASGAGPMARHRRPPGARAGPRRRASDWRTSASRIDRRSTAARRRSRNEDRRGTGRVTSRAYQREAQPPMRRRSRLREVRTAGGEQEHVDPVAEVVARPFETPRGAPPRCPRRSTDRRCSSAPARRHRGSPGTTPSPRRTP